MKDQLAVAVARINWRNSLTLPKKTITFSHNQQTFPGDHRIRPPSTNQPKISTKPFLTRIAWSLAGNKEAKLAFNPPLERDNA
jgi:hypothetical protein